MPNITTNHAITYTASKLNEHQRLKAFFANISS